MLEALAQQPDPVGIEALSTRLGRHHNTVREQLNWLVDHGYVRRHRVPGEGRGRPAWHYESWGPRPTEDDYAEMAASLAWHLADTDRRATRDEVLGEGRTWGAELATGHGHGRQPSEAEGRGVTVALLDELGFEPVPDPEFDQVTLQRCPLLQAAHQYPDVVCTMHEGLVAGALEVHGADPEQVSLKPFANHDGCALTLLTHD